MKGQWKALSGERLAVAAGGHLGGGGARPSTGEEAAGQGMALSLGRARVGFCMNFETRSYGDLPCLRGAESSMTAVWA